MDLTLDVRLDGFDRPVGTLKRDGNNALTFTYSKIHLTAANAHPLSLSLPLSDVAYDDVVARAFFDNLLQERDDTLRAVIAREGLSRDDVAGLLFHIGKDCAGAISVLPGGAPAAKVPGDLGRDYDPITDQRLSEIIRALHERRRLPDGVNDPSPLAGVQSKIAITQLADGRFAEPRPGNGAPTTHIIKVPDQDHPRDAAFETETMSLSRALGVATAETRILRRADVDALLVKRFDRAVDTDGRVVRIHQEDFAQALGLPAALKYERQGTADRKFDVIGIARVLNATATPAAARDGFIQATLFDLMTGNVDGHAKNHALLYRPNGAVELAPRYDLLPTRLDPNLTDEFAFKLGSAQKLEALTAGDFDGFLAAVGVVNDAARRRLRTRHGREIARVLGAALPGLQQKGMKVFADLIAANMRVLLPLIGVDVPESARGRDAFINRGGGWAQG